MQGWLFQSGFWQPEQVEAYLTSVPQVTFILTLLYHFVSGLTLSHTSLFNSEFASYSFKPDSFWNKKSLS